MHVFDGIFTNFSDVFSRLKDWLFPKWQSSQERMKGLLSQGGTIKKDVESAESQVR